MYSDESTPVSRKEIVLDMVNEILQPNYYYEGQKLEFDSYKGMHEHLVEKHSFDYDISESTFIRYLKGTHFVKIGNKFTISPMYYKEQYRDMLKQVLKLSRYEAFTYEDDDSIYTLSTDAENDIIIIELIKKIFPFDAISCIEKDYRRITVYFNFDAFTEDDKQFLDNLF